MIYLEIAIGLLFGIDVFFLWALVNHAGAITDGQKIDRAMAVVINKLLRKVDPESYAKALEIAKKGIDSERTGQYL